MLLHLYLLLRVGQIEEQLLAQTLVPERPVERLDENILSRLVRLNETELNPMLTGPSVKNGTRELRGTVTYDLCRQGLLSAEPS